MYKVFIFLLAFLFLILLGSVAVVMVVGALTFVKDLIDDWRE